MIYYLSMKEKASFFSLKNVAQAFALALVVFVGLPVQAAERYEKPVNTDGRYRGVFVSQSVPDPIQIIAGETKTVTVLLKNTGTATWPAKGNNFVSAYTIAPKYHNSLFAAKDWKGSDQTAAISATTKPGATAKLIFSLTAPTKVGEYTEYFSLAAEDVTWIQGATFYFKIKVVASKKVPAAALVNSVTSTLPLVASTIETVTATTADPFSVVATSSRALISPPNIRVGLYAVTKPIEFSSETDYHVFSGNVEQGILSSGTAAELMYSSGEYSFTSDGLTFTSEEKIRLVPDDLMAVFSLTNYDRRLAGRTDTFNAYRGIFELAYAPTSKVPYAINELPLDEYVAGVTEVSNNSPYEYVLAMAVTERSYAYNHIQYAAATKKVFDVVPTTADQLYLGYKAEIAAPKIAAAAYATAGQMVTYQGNPVVTPYFSHSDGRTRSWKEVWGGGSKPWLVSVVASYDKGKSKLGHGVGMSGLDALLHAANDGWKYDEILKYYYTGTEVEQVY